MDEKSFGPVHFIPGENDGKYPNCHSLYIEKSGVLIDPSSDRDRLLDLRNKTGVKEVWLSHWHEDHFMHLDLFDDIPLCMMEQDAPPLSDIEILMDFYGLDEEYKKYWRPLFQDKFHFKPRQPARFLQDQEWIDLVSTRVKIISAPGHTPGHMALLFEEPNLLFMADYDLSKFGPWYGDVHSSIEQTINSVNSLKKIPASKWITSHEKGIFEHDPGELWDDYLNVINIREKKLLNFLEKPRTFSEIVQACIVYRKPREPKYFFEFGEKAHMKKHLNKLMSENIVTLENGRYSI